MVDLPRDESSDDFVVSTVDDPAAAYTSGEAWARGPQLVYDRLAEVAFARLPPDLSGLTAADVGAGTGAATRVLVGRGASVLAVDASSAMLIELSRQVGARVATVLGDVRALPVASRSHDLVVAAFVINHLHEPSLGLSELARVCRPGGRIVTTTFGADDHPIKAAVDRVLASYGFVAPAWYVAMKKEVLPRFGTVPALDSMARGAGLQHVAVHEVRVAFDDLPLRAVIDYRLGLSHISAFVRDLPPHTQQQIDVDLHAAIAPLPPFELPMLVLDAVAS